MGKKYYADKKIKGTRSRKEKKGGKGGRGKRGQNALRGKIKINLENIHPWSGSDVPRKGCF